MARPRTDPAILEASGAYVKNPNRKPVDMPKYIPGAPEMPAIVAENKQAAWYWNWCCKILDDAGVLNTAYLPILTVHALDWAELMWLYSETKDGNVTNCEGKVSPEAAQLHQYANRFLKELTEFGLTPASKSKIIAAGGKKEPDSFAEMLARRMGPKPN
jgi:phage terminase small subunit